MRFAAGAVHETDWNPAAESANARVVEGNAGVADSAVAIIRVEGLLIRIEIDAEVLPHPRNTAITAKPAMGTGSNGPFSGPHQGSALNDLEPMRWCGR